jgi:hypothetical protein
METVTPLYEAPAEEQDRRRPFACASFPGDLTRTPAALAWPLCLAHRHGRYASAPGPIDKTRGVILQRFHLFAAALLALVS